MRNIFYIKIKIAGINSLLEQDYKVFQICQLTLVKRPLVMAATSKRCPYVRKCERMRDAAFDFV